MALQTYIFYLLVQPVVRYQVGLIYSNGSHRNILFFLWDVQPEVSHNYVGVYIYSLFSYYNHFFLYIYRVTKSCFVHLIFFFSSLVTISYSVEWKLPQNDFYFGFKPKKEERMREKKYIYQLEQVLELFWTKCTITVSFHISKMSVNEIFSTINFPDEKKIE